MYINKNKPEVIIKNDNEIDDYNSEIIILSSLSFFKNYSFLKRGY